MAHNRAVDVGVGVAEVATGLGLGWLGEVVGLGGGVRLGLGVVESSLSGGVRYRLASGGYDALT